MSPRVALDAEACSTFEQSLQSAWADNQSRCTAQITALHILGECLDQLMPAYPIFSRAVEMADEEANFGFDFEMSGIMMVSADSEDRVMDAMMSAFIRSGYLPDRQTLLLGGVETSWEEISNFICQWRDSNKSGRGNRIFAIVIDGIAQNLQHATALALKEAELEDSCTAPMLLLSSTASKSTVANQFSHRRTGYQSLSRETIQSAVHAALREDTKDRQLAMAPADGVSSKNSGLSVVVVSGESGSGKTFDIRLHAERHAEEAQYIHLPVNAAVSAAQVPDACLLHGTDSWCFQPVYIDASDAEDISHSHRIPLRHHGECSFRIQHNVWTALPVPEYHRPQPRLSLLLSPNSCYAICGDSSRVRAR